MHGEHKTRMVGWHPKSAGLVAWLDEEIARRGGGRGAQSEILEEALAAYAKLTEAIVAEVLAARKEREGADDGHLVLRLHRHDLG
jgi:hypothetical protein